MGRAGPVGRFSEIPARLSNTLKIGHAITWKLGQPGQPGSRLWATGIPADTFPCNRTQRASPSWQACDTHAHMTFNHDDERQEVQIDNGNGRKTINLKKNYKLRMVRRRQAYTIRSRKTGVVKKMAGT